MFVTDLHLNLSAATSFYLTTARNILHGQFENLYICSQRIPGSWSRATAGAEIVLLLLKNWLVRPLNAAACLRSHHGGGRLYSGVTEKSRLGLILHFHHLDEIQKFLAPTCKSADQLAKTASHLL